jgi:hypothetical protein
VFRLRGSAHDDARIKERYLINKMQPGFNITMNNGSRFKFEINDFKSKYIAVDRAKYLAPRPVKKNQSSVV